MAKKNWFIEANKSQDPEVKAMLEQYNSLDANAADYQTAKDSMVVAIKSKLGLLDEQPLDPEKPVVPGGVEEPVESDEVKAEMDQVAEEVVAAENAQDDSEIPNSEEEPTNSKPESVVKPRRAKVFDGAQAEFDLTEDDVAKTKNIDELREIRVKCREEIKRLENTRLKHGTYQQNRILDMQIWSVRRIVSLSLRREVAIKQRLKQLEKAGKISSVAMKRARFIKLFRQGFSITNITLHPQGVKKSELKTVLDAETVQACVKINSRFKDMWQRWQAKFIDNADKK